MTIGKINISAISDCVSCILSHQRKLQMALLVNSTHPSQNYFLFIASAVVLSYSSCLILVFPYCNIFCWKDLLFLFAFLVMFLMGCTSVVAQMVNNLPTMQDTLVRSMVQVDLLEKRMATHFSILAWKIPLTEEPGGLQSMGSQRVRCYWVTAAATDAKSLQSCQILWDPIACSPPGSAVPGILQARTLEWVAISFSNWVTKHIQYCLWVTALFIKF